MTIFPTRILELLMAKKSLRKYLDVFCGEKAVLYERFLQEVYLQKFNTSFEEIQNEIPFLIKYGLVSEVSMKKERGACSLRFAEVINFELTYDCDKNCSHCLQQNLHKNKEKELTTEQVKEVILYSHLIGLSSMGLNFTGGEVLGNRHDFFEILDYVYKLKIPYRINTNSWWANKKSFEICKIYFSEAIDLVKFLKSKGIYMFAFSFDSRYGKQFRLADDLISSIKICEELGVYYQLVFSGEDSHTISRFIQYLAEKNQGRLRYIIPVQMEMVDIGGAADMGSQSYQWQSNKRVCKGKGFYRPNILHVDPYGGIRTCIYAVGSSNVGHLQQNSFVEIINRFPQERANLIFANKEALKNTFETLLKPYLWMYKSMLHDCTKSIVLSKVASRYFENQAVDLEEVHREIGAELNLGSGGF